jgi:hypothetical protein
METLMRFPILLLAGAVLVAGCQAESNGAESPASEAAGTQTMPQPPADEGAPAVNTNEPDAAECGADKLERWVDAELSDAVKADIREAVGHGRIRYIAPGDMVTMDFRPDRLNVETGDDGRIKLFRCG